MTLARLSPFGITDLNLRNVERITATVGDPLGLEVALNLTIKSEDGQEFEATLWLPKRERSYARDIANALNRTANNYGLLTSDEQIDLLDCTEEEIA